MCGGVVEAAFCVRTAHVVLGTLHAEVLSLLGLGVRLCLVVRYTWRHSSERVASVVATLFGGAAMWLCPQRLLSAHTHLR